MIKKIIGFTIIIIALIIVLVCVSCDATTKSTPELAYHALGNDEYCVTIGDATYITDIVISSKYDNKPVTRIPPEAFKDAIYLETIVIPEGITIIDDLAFYGCKNLKSVVIPEGVMHIGKEAFYGCENLTTVVIPESVGSIGYSAFDGCRKINKVEIRDIASWCNIDFKNEYSNPLWRSTAKLYLNGDEATNITIPDGVRRISKYAFDGASNVSSIDVPKSVVYIGEKAFFGCSSLKGITIPYGVKKIESDTFSYCKSLEYVTIPNSVTSIGRRAFAHCEKLSAINIPNTVSEIGPLAFQACSSLTSIAFPESVTSMGYGAIQHCYSLVEITLPFVGSTAAKTTLSERGLLGHVFGKENPVGMPYDDILIFVRQYYKNDHSDYGFCGLPVSLRSVTVLGGDIPYGAFYNCYGITNITLGKNVTSIGENAFYNTSTTSITFEGTRKDWDSVKKERNWSCTVNIIYCTDGHTTTK